MLKLVCLARLRRISRVLTVAAFGAPVAFVAGCNYLGAAVLAIEGPPKIEKITDLPTGRPLVVFVDDPQNKLPRRSVREAVARAAEEDIIREELTDGAKVISSAAAMRIAATERYGEPMSIVEIGRRVGAEIILYVRVDSWTLAREVGVVSPVAVARIKILDTKENKRLWPDEAVGYVMQAMFPVQSQEAPSTLDERTALENQFAQYFGREISRLFYKHERQSVSDKNLRP